jgi:putative endonuclease
LYIGQTSSLEKRIDEHNSGMCRSTKLRIPFKIVYSVTYETRSEAMKREKELKSGKRRKYIRELLYKKEV